VVEYPAFPGQTSEVLHADTNPIGLLLQESSGARSTEMIGCHFPWLFQAIFQVYHHGALTFDPYDSFNVGAKMEQAGANRQ